MAGRNGVKKVLDKVLKRVTPSEREKARTERVVKEAMGVAEKILKKSKASPVLAGSYTRDTWMPDKKEFEIFMVFSEGVSREELEKKGLSLGKKIVKEMKGSHIIAYAEHPYVRARIKGYMVDIVPCYGVKSPEKIRSAVDRTPFHNRYISRKLRKELSPEVRLLKRFCKGLGIYGSDTRTRGFSGYLCELLIIEYGGFLGLLNGVAEWEPGRAVIDLEDYHKGKIPQELGKRFRFQPLIVIDPVDRNRNVAAALSPDNFMQFVSSCKGFLEKPDLIYFFPRKKRVNIRALGKRIRERDSALLLLRFRQPYVIQDVLWPQLRRFVKRLKDIMEDKDFSVIGHDIWSDEEFTKGICLVLLEMEVWELPEVRKVTGPPIFSRKHSQEFLKKYKPRGRTWVENQCWVAEVKREFTSAEALLRHALSGRAGTLRERGIPSYIAKSVFKGFSILKGREILKLAKRQEIGEFLNNYLGKAL